MYVNKKSKNRGRSFFNQGKWLLALAALVFLMVGAWILCYDLITEQIIKIAVENMKELSKHDERSIGSNLENKWEVLKGIGRYLRIQTPDDTAGLCGEMEDCGNLMDCLRMTLVSDDASYVNSIGESGRDEAMLDGCREGKKMFAYRIENPDAEQEGWAEELRMGVQIDPIVVEGITYRYLTARLAIDAIESDLKIDSYNGLGYSSVIDPDGSYIVNSFRDQIPGNNNFFTALDRGGLPKDYPMERIRELIANLETFSFEYTREDGERCVIVFDPMPKIQWFFITVVPRSVFEQQSMALISIFAVLTVILMAVVIWTSMLLLRRRAKSLLVERKHREELADALALAEQANRAKTTFLNNMSHDIRTPMNAIIGFTALASTHIDNRERVLDYLGKIGQSSNHLLSLINDILDMSRIESGKVNIKEKPENLAEILHSLRDIIQADIHSRQLEFFIDTVDVIDENIYCDRLRLNQVLLNILSNAMKFTPPGGTVSMRITERTVSRTGYASYEFCIKDTGIGMSPEFVKTIFEPFTREHSSTVSNIQGTGLGMAITKTIVDMMGGVIVVHSEESKGSEFIVTLDLRLQEEQREVPRIERLVGLRGLVVDDDINTCQSVAQMLRQIGMRSEWTMYGKEAVVRTEEALKLGDQFHVYIIDWLMPDLNGIETVRRIRQVVGSSAPIIILSAYDWADIEDEARRAGVTDFVSKPLFLSDLHRVLLRACGDLEEAAPEPLLSLDMDFQGRRILLVEDNELNKEIAQELLYQEGFLVETAENGQEAVNTVQERQPGWFDLVLMDVQMPVMDGYEATRQIRALADPVRASVPIIAMTANAFDEDRQAAAEAGMDGHVGKPIDIPVLLKILRDVLTGDQAKAACGEGE